MWGRRPEPLLLDGRNECWRRTVEMILVCGVSLFYVDYVVEASKVMPGVLKGHGLGSSIYHEAYCA